MFLALFEIRARKEFLALCRLFITSQNFSHALAQQQQQRNCLSTISESFGSYSGIIKMLLHAHIDTEHEWFGVQYTPYGRALSDTGGKFMFPMMM